jgi:hypothetical protein
MLGGLLLKNGSQVSMNARSPAMQFYFRQFAGDENVLVMDLDAVKKWTT